MSPGKYYVRVRGSNASGQGPASNEVVVTVGCSRAPRPPRLASSANGRLVSLVWSDDDNCSGVTYRITAGASPGTADLGSFRTDSPKLVAAVPPGAYYVRVAAESAFGTSAPSNEVHAAVDSGCAPPAFETTLTAAVRGTEVTLNWNPIAVAAAAAVDMFWPLSFTLEVGRSHGASDLATVSVGRVTGLTTAAPAGTYYVRVRPTDACGTGRASNEVVVQVT